jgi:Fungal Zn(2)-Cys(6) binuclear cluster domain
MEEGEMAFYYHTLPACNRCRKRKSRCDIGRPLCGPCKVANTPCEFTHASTGQIISRSYVYQLENQLERLEAENNNKARENDERFSKHANKQPPREIVESPEGAANCDGGVDSKAHADLIVLGEDGGDAHFLGLSSGIHIARAVLESAAQETDGHENDPGVRSFREENHGNVQQRPSPYHVHSLNPGLSISNANSHLIKW